LKGLPVPSRLHRAIKPVQKKVVGFEPTACFTPQIDGRLGNYFEWLAAGRIGLAAGGAMYSSGSSLEDLYYGYDQTHLYFRFDQPELLRQLCGKNGCFEIRLIVKELFQLRYHFTDATLEILSDGKTVADGTGACGKILELAVPLTALQLQVGDIVNLSCHALQNGRENGRWPTEGNASFCFRGTALDEENWII